MCMHMCMTYMYMSMSMLGAGCVYNQVKSGSYPYSAIGGNGMCEEMKKGKLISYHVRTPGPRASGSCSQVRTQDTVGLVLGRPL